jgi:hypothetical protein
MGNLAATPAVVKLDVQTAVLGIDYHFQGAVTSGS